MTQWCVGVGGRWRDVVQQKGFSFVLTVAIILKKVFLCIIEK